MLSAALLAGACGDERAAAPAATPPGWTPGTVWVAADRDGDALVELDGELYVLGRRPLESPLLVRAGGAAVWVVHAPGASPSGPLALRPWGASGAGASRGVGEVLDLEVDRAGRALVLEREASGARLLTRVGPTGEACDLAAPPGAVALAHGPQGLGLALGRGGWAEGAGDGVWRVRRGLDGGEVLDLAPSPGGGWWTLVRLPGEPDSLCVALDARGVPCEVWPAGDARVLARRARGPWAWEPDARALHVARGRTLALALSGARAAVGDGQGGLVVAAAGALLRLTPGGAPGPGQGGFARLVDVERLPGRR